MNEIERLKKSLIDDPGAESTAKSFGVLIPIIETPHGLSVLFEVRARNLRRQPGEICFPGGSTMEGEPPAHAAIREASEELLIAPSSIEVLDELAIVNIYSGGTLQPVVGLLRDYEYTFSSDEVAEVFTVPLAFFLENQPERYDVAMRSVPVEGFPYDRIEGGKAYAWDSSYRTIYFYHHEGRNIWGLTAGIVNDFIEKIKRGGYLK